MIHLSGWRPPITFLYLFLFHSLLRLASFLSQYKNDKLLARSELLCDFCKLWSARCALDHHDQGLRCVRCYARRLGAIVSGRNAHAHAKAQAALGPGLRQTSHAIVRPLRPPFLSFSLPPSDSHNHCCRYQ